jgi:Domain of unknown function (DUF4288)
MNWYVAKLIFRIISGDGNHCAQFEEQLRLISAECEQDAFGKACNIGRANQDSFLNCHNETVLWQFIGVTEINQLTELNDGVELYYRICEASDAEETEQYMTFTRHKSALLAISAEKERSMV